MREFEEHLGMNLYFNVSIDQFGYVSGSHGFLGVPCYLAVDAEAYAYDAGVELACVYDAIIFRVAKGTLHYLVIL